MKDVGEKDFFSLLSKYFFLDNFIVFIPSPLKSSLIPWYTWGSCPCLSVVKNNFFVSRTIVKDPFLTSEEETKILGLEEKALIFPLDRKGPAEGFLILFNPPIIDLKSPDWHLKWEAFYEGFKLRSPQPNFNITSDNTLILEKSKNLTQTSPSQILLSWPRDQIFESWITTKGRPLSQVSDSFYHALLKLAGERGDVYVSKSRVSILLPYSLNLNPQLYVIQCMDFFKHEWNMESLAPLEVKILNSNLLAQEIEN
ncbi:MAG: hypothetical protein A2Z96_00800 [Spirochaetes bacterium GWB1_48_6]|nr:MAG: hypothetical protein A2Z96_00800 [Spirochaetes bacterium GWB1_48_6]